MEEPRPVGQVLSVLQADRIIDAHVFMGGQDDFNVPILGSEQMYQALKTMNVPTQLVVYPGQNHGLTRCPSCAIGWNALACVREVFEG